MGKHERQKIEEAEKIIVKILNSQKLTTSDRENYWIDHAFAIAKKIKEDFPYIKIARHLGNRYDNTGDILILSNKREFFIETKMSDTKTGIGTKANIGQDALTENLLFENNPKSWSEFRRDKKHEEWVNDYLNHFVKYPKYILKITNPILQKEEKARYLRELKKKKNKTAENILNLIHERDKKEKIEYLNYLKGQKQRKEMIKKFFVLITLGIHKKDVLENLIKSNNFFQEAQNLFVYYSNIFQGKVIVHKEDVGEKVRKIMERFLDFAIIFPKDVTHCKIVGIKKDGSREPLLQIVLHWKNIAQGIKTPCLNIFDLTG
jgi:hypothetical protein